MEIPLEQSIEAFILEEDHTKPEIKLLSEAADELRKRQRLIDEAYDRLTPALQTLAIMRGETP